MTMPRRPSEPCVAVVVPIRQLHDNGVPVIRRRPGRPRRVESSPTVSEQVYLDAVAEAVERGIEQDEVVVASSAGDPKKVVDEVMSAVARETGALLWDRIKSQREGKAEAEKISSRRVAGLMRLAELAVVREQLESEDPEPKHEHVEKILGMLMAEVEQAVSETASPEIAQRFLSALKTKMSASGLPSTGRTP